MPIIAILGLEKSQIYSFCLHLEKINLCRKKTFLVPDLNQSTPPIFHESNNFQKLEWLMKTQLAIENLFTSIDETIIFTKLSTSYLVQYPTDARTLENVLNETKKSVQKFDLIFWATSLPADSPSLTDELILLKKINQNVIILPNNWGNWDTGQWERETDCWINNMNQGQLSGRQNKQVKKQYLVVLAKVLNKGKILMIKRSTPQIEQAHNRWDLPGGGVDFGEDPMHCAAREVFEETGYLVKPISLLPIIHSNKWIRVDGSSEHAIVICINCVLCHSSPFNIEKDQETKEIQWIAEDKIKEMSLVRGVEKFIPNNS